MGSISELVRAKLTALAKQAAAAVFTVSRHERDMVANSFARTFWREIEKKEALEQMETMEGEGCPNREAD